MPPITWSTFRSGLRELRLEEFTAFAADLWSARGFETRLDGNVVVVTRPDGPDGSVHRERIAVEPTGEGTTFGQAFSETSDGIDVILTRTGVDNHLGGPDVETVEADDLYEMLLYAVPRSTAESLVHRYLGRDLRLASADGAPSKRGGADGAGSIVSGAVARRLRDALDTTPAWVSLAAAVLVVFLLLTATGGLPTSGLDVADDGGEPSAPSSVATVESVAVPTDIQKYGRCLDTPEEATRHQIEMLRTAEGIRTVWERGTHEFRRYAGTYEEFNLSIHTHPFVHMLDPARVEYGRVMHEGPTARQNVTVTGETSRQYRYVFTFALATTGDGPDCWRLDGLTYRE